MKKGFVLFIFTILCILIYSENVDALEQDFSLVAPSEIYISQQEGSRSVKPEMDTWYGNKRVWTGGYYSFSGSSDPIPGGIAYVWNSTSLCSGQTYVLYVDMYTDGNTTFFNEVSPTVYANGKVCQIVYNSGNAITASCSGLGFENQPLNISINWHRFPIYYSVKIGLGVDTKVACDVTNGDVINNQNEQTNIIIGSILGSLDRDLSFIDENNDKRKNEIIQNQEKNKQEQIDNANKNQEQTNERLDNINNSITDDTPPDLGNLGSSAGWLPAGLVDSIINLPLTFMQSISNSLSNTCDPLDLTVPFINNNKEFTLPCVNSIYNQIPGFGDFYNWIGLITSAFILYRYLLSLYKWVDDTLTFRENTWQDWGGV